MIAAALALTLSGGADAEHIKVGISKLLGYPGVPIAVERGYFKAEGIDVEMVYLDSAQPIAIAVASGDVDFGIAGMSASFYTLGAQGQLRLIASSGGEAAGFHNLVYLGSNRAYESGLTSPKDFPATRSRSPSWEPAFITASGLPPRNSATRSAR
jgi:NitT/TauT family transport system substrate-binding protein